MRTPSAPRLAPMALIALLAPSSPAPADEGRIPIHLAPVTILTPGEYFLTRDVAGTSPIVIAANDVTLDLNQHLVTGNPGSPVITVGSTNGNVTIRNGTVEGGSNGIIYSNVTNGRSIRMRVEGVTVRNSTLVGIGVVNTGTPTAAEYLEIRRCVVNNAGNVGIYVNTSSQLLAPVVADNVVAGTGQHGIQLYSEGGIVARNSVASFGGTASSLGIWVRHGTLVQDNVVTRGGPDDYGIQSGGGGQVVGNTVYGCGATAITAWNGDVVSGNVVNDNGGDGIHAQGDNVLVDRNQCRGNGQCGIRFSTTTHAYRDNMLRGNSGGATCGSIATNAGGNIP